MIGVDTNILVRYITQDHAKQSALATHFIESQCTQEKPGYISLIVTCELVWVLTKAYAYEKALIIKIIKKLLSSVELFIDEADIVFMALQDYEKGKADYPDYVIAHCAKRKGVYKTVTFDIKAGKEQFFQLLTSNLN